MGAGRVARSKELAPEIRGAFRRALMIIEERDGMSFSEMVVQAIDTHGILAVLNVISKFTPKEIEFSNEATVKLDTTKLPADTMQQLIEIRQRTPVMIEHEPQDAE